jgi:glucose/arabinose dehydrogenase
VELETVADGLVAPLGVTHAGDGSGRLFIWEQSGQILIVENGMLLAAPFLDISDKLPELNTFFDERGLLGLAFHPDYANNGRFFVRYSAARDGDPSEPCFGTSRGCHEEILAEYAVSGTNPNVANPGSERILFRIDEPQFNHDAGDVAFGPDGLLYFTLGDGGGAGDGLADVPPSHGPIGNGQNIETALGAILRIDVDGQTPPLEYRIPPDNPFVGVPGVDEIYAYGLRNPYKFSFDDGPGGDGSLFLADVGQDLFEEVNIVERGGNYGWVIREGLHCFDPFNPGTPPPNCPNTGPLGEPLLDPIVEYSHDVGGITVVGGFVYRGSCSRVLSGKYVFGDFAAAFTVPSGRLYFLIEPTPGSFEIREFQIGIGNVPYGLFLKGFGEGEDGEIYVCGSTELAPVGSGGVVHRLVPEDCRPTAVELASFEAVSREREMIISWRTTNEEDNLGFNINRSREGREAFARVNADLIASSGERAGEYDFIDRTVTPGETYVYQLEAIDRFGGTQLFTLAPVTASRAAPRQLVLHSAEPNPFNPSTTISFALPEAGPVELTVHDGNGRTIRTLVDATLESSEHSVEWDGRDDNGQSVGSGVYIYRLEAGGRVLSERMVLIK